MQAIVTLAHDSRLSSHPAFVRLIGAIDRMDMATAGRCFVSLATSRRFRGFMDHMRNTLTLEQKKEIFDTLIQQITLVLECMDPETREIALGMTAVLRQVLRPFAIEEA